jgi:hypothetical protein
MSDPIADIKSLLRLADQRADSASRKRDEQTNQIIYLSDKLAKVFHELRSFNNSHGRDLHPEVQDAFNAAWRNHESSFDIWQSYYNNSQPNNTNDQS